ncbi:hypothetical protein MK805_13870 [Shimazuella sp. AN120528]|uniref:hypothetical protein n=1 Tax=Shimazuella soli TaxID=1892854 RepID=UPI001F0E1354|nr:hypothetical protein [Shimazuella soli]MCH5586026.1 hypothetical protein [Shimazuella soli]
MTELRWHGGNQIRPRIPDEGVFSRACEKTDLAFQEMTGEGTPELTEKSVEESKDATAGNTDN